MTSFVSIRRASAAVLLLAAAPALAADARPSPSPPASPYLRPEMRPLMDAVTLHLSFDRADMTPDMAEGPEWKPSVFGAGKPPGAQPQFAPGLRGKALVLGTGGAVYPRAGNLLLEKRGAVAVWIKPENWQRPNDGNCEFVMTGDAAFYLQRQGPLLGEDGQVRRHEVVQYLVRDQGGRLAGASDYTPWQNGRWYLLVANWSWPSFELSVDGGPFDGKPLAAPPGEGTFGPLVVGSRSGSARGLLDELLAFRRPLGLEEVKLLRRALLDDRAQPE